MAKITVPLSNYMDRRGGRVEEGTYAMRVADVTVGETKNGDLMLTTYLVIQGHGEADGTTIVDRFFPAMESAQWRFVSFLQALGVRTPRKNFQLDTDSLKGRRLDVTVQDGDPYQGVIRSEPVGYARAAATPSSGGDLEDVTADAGDSDVAEAESVAAEDSTSGSVVDMDDELSLDDIEEV